METYQAERPFRNPLLDMVLYSFLPGGSPYVAAKINEAKDYLEGNLKD